MVALYRLSDRLVRDVTTSSGRDDGNNHLRTRVDRVAPIDSHRMRIEESRGPHTLRRGGGRVGRSKGNDGEAEAIVIDYEIKFGS